MTWTLEADEYENGNSCWCASGPDEHEANFSHRQDAETFLNALGVEWTERALSERAISRSDVSEAWRWLLSDDH
jgi:hypothetical protein